MLVQAACSFVMIEACLFRKVAAVMYQLCVCLDTHNSSLAFCSLRLPNAVIPVVQC